MSGGNGHGRSTAVLRTEHRAGSGPDSIYVHAVAPNVVAGGPVALCGYPLREATLHAPLAAGGSFEVPAGPSVQRCPECLAALALEEAPIAARPGGVSRAWMKWGAISLATVTSLGGLVGVVIALAQR